VKTGFEAFSGLNEALHRIAELEAENAILRKALQTLAEWAPSYPANANIDRMRKFAAATAHTQEKP
jgi:hypothetical protein